MRSGATSPASGGYGLPFAYDPLWRWQTDHANGGIYLFDTNNPDYNTTPGVTPEARFAAGDALRTLVPNDNDGNGPPSAYGLQRLTNFNRPGYDNTAGTYIQPVMPAANFVPNIFVSPEDIVWQEATNTNNVYTIGGVPGPGDSRFIPPQPGRARPEYSVVPGAAQLRLAILLDVHGPAEQFVQRRVVRWEHRRLREPALRAGPISVAGTHRLPGRRRDRGRGRLRLQQERGHRSTGYTYGYGAGADRTVLIRWNGSAQADPVVKVGDFIADVTYERIQNTVTHRFLSFNGGGVPNPLNNGEWDNLPAQRCFWYQVQKITPAQIDPSLGFPYRSMVVYVNRKLEARTLLNPTTGNPVYMNAVLVCPYVVNVIPQTFFVR